MAKQPPPAPDEPAPPTGEIVLYQTEDGRTRVECRFVDETLWLSQALIAELFQKDVRTVNEHLQNLYAEGEIEAQATIRKFRIVRREGSREVAREIEHYNSGAAASGSMTPDSDIDLLVVGPATANTLAGRAELHEALRGLGFACDVFVIGTSRFEETKEIFGGIAYPAHRYGRVVYAAA